jgi:hypothetical protein
MSYAILSSDWEHCMTGSRRRDGSGECCTNECCNELVAASMRFAGRSRNALRLVFSLLLVLMTRNMLAEYRAILLEKLLLPNVLLTLQWMFSLPSWRQS